MKKCKKCKRYTTVNRKGVCSSCDNPSSSSLFDSDSDSDTVFDETADNDFDDYDDV